MKKILLTVTLFFTLSPFAVQASQKVTCESLKAEIAQKIIKNGVPETGFRLEVVPNDQVAKGDAANGKVVGHCDNSKQKIVYIRLAHTKTDNQTSSDKKSQE
ncbi:membrane protein [Xenorhabdus beddingii]|uniref:Membrane protein n=1 Tax=Xenorhabdus beddingii TaxID=40578 RepID=A0A1Y2SM83_9GAMM|nr:membrane protein [Xenorhabdus beddingii]